MTTRKRSPSGRSKATFDLPADLLDEMRVLSMEVPLREIGGSLSGLAEQSLRARVEDLRAEYNGGRPFKSAKGTKPRGRRGRPPGT